MDFTGAFDNMPDCMVVVKRNLDREDGFEEVYLNKAFKNKKSLTDSFESNVLLKIFRDRYDEIKRVISDIFAGIKKAEMLCTMKNLEEIFLHNFISQENPNIAYIFSGKNLEAWRINH